MSRPLRVCLIGFSEFEGAGLASSLRLAVPRQPGYLPVAGLDEAELIVVNADQSESLATVVRLGRLDQAVFLGSEAPAHAEGWLPWPVDTAQLLRELDRLAISRGLVAAAPDSDGDPPAPAPAVATPGAAIDAAPAGWARALLVDDSEVALRFLETRLHREGLFTERASTSEQAWALLARKPYDFVFLDVELGSGSPLDGLALCQQIKRPGGGPRATAAPVVVLVSAHHAEVDRARGALAGCDAYLAKPLDLAQLHRVLQPYRR